MPHVARTRAACASDRPRGGHLGERSARAALRPVCRTAAVDTAYGGPREAISAANREEALQACRQAASTRPPSPRYAYQYGRVLFNAFQRDDEAIRQFAAARDGGNPWGALGLGTAYAWARRREGRVARDAPLPRGRRRRREGGLGEHRLAARVRQRRGGRRPRSREVVPARRRRRRFRRLPRPDAPRLQRVASEQRGGPCLGPQGSRRRLGRRRVRARRGVPHGIALSQGRGSGRALVRKAARRGCPTRCTSSRCSTGPAAASPRTFRRVPWMRAAAEKDHPCGPVRAGAHAH